MLTKSVIFKLTKPIYRLIASTIVAIIIWFISEKLYLPIRLTLVYDSALLIYLFALILRMTYATAEDTLYFSQREESNHVSIIVFIIFISFTSYIAVGVMLENDPNWSRLMINLKIGLSLIAIVLSWVLVHIFFALHYASIYYQSLSKNNNFDYRKGLVFPNKGLEDYWDFMYYSFTIAMCYQTSDISVSDTIIRRWTLIHSILSFLFVAVIVGLVVNAISNLV
ncbi:DUF1345 domain-containing protein [Gloeothece verrucosa]|uniref:DUF1345 domain-containing protein n=1 Tax=Gloeothece verrucosa (strain PCC 7822) TaxID=497965 RepID=E0UKQ1_GLOV7|nr:DUF1345 domain-containing protein [Gloeothece verrucosa]ADN17531.1 protein of unknown function DUF1345 [Gloeothece verrucosa PCC 7822]